MLQLEFKRVFNKTIDKYELRQYLREESYAIKFLRDNALEIYKFFYNRFYSKKVKLKKQIKSLASPFMYFFIFKLNWFYND